MTIKTTLQGLLDHADSGDQRAAGQWLARVEVLLEWTADHPGLHEVRNEAARLLADYRAQGSAAGD